MNYKEILHKTLKYGVPKQPTRIENGETKQVENPTRGIFGAVFEHDMSQGFPLSGLRELPFKSTCVELEGFLRGVTKKQWFQDRKCKFWDHWASPAEVSNVKKRLPEVTDKIAKFLGDDLGPLGYSFELRNFGGWKGFGGVDQIQNLVNKLRNTPYDRRMIVSNWNPQSVDESALPPCHLLHNVCVYGDTLNLWWHQRSCDILANQTITTYALLMLLYCKESGLKPGILNGVFVDCHLYENQIPAAKIILERNEPPLPEVEIPSKPDGSFSIFDWTHKDVLLTNYRPHGKVDIGEITV